MTLLAGFGSADALAGDWSNWRGPEQTGVSREAGLPDKWDAASGENVVWRAEIGGRTTPIVQRGRVYLITRAGDGISQQERVVALDEKTGKLQWEYKFNVWHTGIVTDRLGWTNMVGDPETDTVFAHGTQGLLMCFNRDGKVVWQHSLAEEYGRISGYGGRITSPIIDGNLLIISMLNASWGYEATGRTRLVAFDKKTGKVAWWASAGFPPKDTYYSTPVVAVIKGERLVITGGGDGGVHAFKVHTGEKVWSYIFASAAVNCSPVVSGDLVYIGHGENNLMGGLQGKVICLDASQVKDGQPKLVWEVDGIKAKFASPIFADGRLYICNDAGLLYCLDGKDGKQHWRFRYGRNSKGSPVLADGKIYVGEEDGKFHILKPGDTSCTRLHAQEFSGEVINGSPAVANGRVFFMTTEQMFCIGLKEAGKPGVVPAPIKEPAAAPGAAVAHVRVFPADVVLHPGDTTDFTALGYDEHGHPLGMVKVDWSLVGSRLPEGLPPPAPGTPPPPALQGTLSDAAGSTTTKLTVAPAPPPGQFGRVLATVPGTKVVGETRVRVAPKLPYKADFSKIPEGRTPGGWVNTQGKFAVVKLPDGSFALKKLAVNPSPLVARANAYIDTPETTDYTIQADVMGTKVGGDLPDAGVVANRYTLMFFGNNRLLRLVSWDALPRIEKNMPWDFKPGVWFRMKLTIEVLGEKALVRGKVWEADKDEPKEWTLEVEDPVPNKEGAPALYANATGIEPPKPGTEVFFKNVSVMPNKGAAPGEKKDAPKPAEAVRPPKASNPAPVMVPEVIVECYDVPRRVLFPRLRRR
jgi:outer membrane protein assembly factor BamB